MTNKKIYDNIIKNNTGEIYMSEYCKLTDEEKELISNTIIKSIMNDAQEIYAENKLQHKNGYYQLKWDFVGTRVIDALTNKRLVVKKTKRGPHTFDLIIDEENGTIYSIMRKSNIIRTKKKQKFSHYLWALASINEDIEVNEGQMNLFSIETAKDYRQYVKQKMLGNINSIITRYCTIVINDDNIQFPSIELHVLDMNLNTLYVEKWKESLTINYNIEYETENDINNMIKLDFKNEENEEIISLKPKKENEEKNNKEIIK